MQNHSAFPSFAASFNNSPNKNSFFKHSSHKQSVQMYSPQPLIQSATLTPLIPQSFVSSTFEEQSLDRYEPNNLSKDPNIRVFCRFRTADKHPSHIQYDTTMIQDGENNYSFDSIFGKFVNQSEVYATVARRHITDFLAGNNSTIFAYGQTGSGKTYTMFGNMRESAEYGIIPRALEQIFTLSTTAHQITCSMLEIYNERIIDLFNPSHVEEEIRFKQSLSTVQLQGLIEASVENKEQLLTLIRLGHRGRKTAATYNNDCSSRSHTVLFVYRTTTDHKNKIIFIDLAGSEKVRKSGVQGQALEETKKINLSLSCLGNVVHALTNHSEHIPYRNSKLTRILRDSLSGDTKTSIITTCSLNRNDYQETISTVKFAVRAKRIKNKLKLNNQEVSMEQRLEQLKKQLKITKKQLQYYKEKDKRREYQEQNVKIPDEMVECQPVKTFFLEGMGVSSRMDRSKVQ